VWGIFPHKRSKSALIAFTLSHSHTAVFLSLSLPLSVSVGATFLLRLSHGNVRDALFAGFPFVSWNAASSNNGGLVLVDFFPCFQASPFCSYT
jgi:hypothetical protein